jgi:hypothetical protein
MHKKIVTATLILAAAFPVAAQARPEVGQDTGFTPSPVAHAQPAAEPAGGGGVDLGFQWGDAGIGAAGAAALMTAGMAGAGVARRRRAARVAG